MSEAAIINGFSNPNFTGRQLVDFLNDLKLESFIRYYILHISLEGHKSVFIYYGIDSLIALRVESYSILYREIGEKRYMEYNEVPSFDIILNIINSKECGG